MGEVLKDGEDDFDFEAKIKTSTPSEAFLLNSGPGASNS